MKYPVNLWGGRNRKKLVCVADGERQGGGRTLVGVLSSWEQSSDVESRSCSEELMKHRPQGSLGDSSCQDWREKRGNVHTHKGEWARTHNRWVQTRNGWIRKYRQDEEQIGAVESFFFFFHQPHELVRVSFTLWPNRWRNFGVKQQAHISGSHRTVRNSP